jgi:predicted esterase
MSDNDSSDDLAGEQRPFPVLRILALHGSEGSGRDFGKNLESSLQNIAEGFDIRVTALNAPYPKGKGFAWWTMNQGERSFNANEYHGFNESETLVRSAFFETLQGGNIDLVVAHSQGAILTASMIARKRFPYFPSKGVVLNGVALPNPYRNELENLVFGEEESIPVLFLMGAKDRINPIESALELRTCLEHAGAKVKTISHQGGHAFPFNDKEALGSLSAWLIEDEKAGVKFVP